MDKGTPLSQTYKKSIKLDYVELILCDLLKVESKIKIKNCCIKIQFY